MSRAGRLTQCDCCVKCYILLNQQFYRKHYILFFIIDKIALRAASGPQAIVRRPLSYNHQSLVRYHFSWKSPLANQRNEDSSLQNGSVAHALYCSNIVLEVKIRIVC